MKPILPNERAEGAEGVSMCPTIACPVFPTTDQLWEGLTVTPGAGWASSPLRPRAVPVQNTPASGNTGPAPVW